MKMRHETIGGVAVIVLCVCLVCLAPKCALCAEKVLPSHKTVDGVRWEFVDDDYGRTITYREDESAVSDKHKLVVPYALEGREVVDFTIAAKSVEEVEVNANLPLIGVDAFKCCPSLRALTIAGDVGVLGREAFQGSGLEELRITGRVKVIERSAFSDCGNLNSIWIGEGTKVIGDAAFAHCGKLEELRIPSSLKGIGAMAFQGCRSIRRISIGGDIRTIQYGAFKDCASLVEVDIDCPLADVASGLFANCQQLKNVRLPHSVTNIADFAFQGCRTLVDFKMPSNVRRIGDCAFSDCESLERFYFPAALEVVGYNAFAGCCSLREIEIADDNPVFSVLNGNVVSKDGAKLVLASCRGESILIPDGIAEIGVCAFSHQISVKEVHIPSSVTNISEWAFVKAYDLQKINVALGNLSYKSVDGFLYSPDGATFCRCPPGVKYAAICEGCTNLSRNAFSYCFKLDHVVLPRSLCSIEEYAFWQCRALSSAVLPSSVVRIAGYSFAGCIALRKMDIPSSVREIGEASFEGCKELVKVSFSEGLQKIHRSAFQGCEKLEEVELPSSLEWIGGNAFACCSTLRKVRFHGDAPRVEEDVFWGTATNLVVEVQQGARGWESDAWRKYKVRFVDPSRVEPDNERTR